MEVASPPGSRTHITPIEVAELGAGRPAPVGLCVSRESGAAGEVAEPDLEDAANPLGVDVDVAAAPRFST